MKAFNIYREIDSLGGNTLIKYFNPKFIESLKPDINVIAKKLLAKFNSIKTMNPNEDEILREFIIFRDDIITLIINKSNIKKHINFIKNFKDIIKFKCDYTEDSHTIQLYLDCCDMDKDNVVHILHIHIYRNNINSKIKDTFKWTIDDYASFPKIKVKENVNNILI